MKCVHSGANLSIPSRRSLQKGLWAGLFAIASVLSGSLPLFTSALTPQLGVPVAAAQDLDAGTLRNYAQALLEIEPVRRNAYDQIRGQTGGQVPQIYCHQRDSLSQLNRPVRDIAVRYCEQSIAIVERNGLTIQEFNQITNALQQNEGLAGRIQQELIRLQN